MNALYRFIRTYMYVLYRYIRTYLYAFLGIYVYYLNLTNRMFCTTEQCDQIGRFFALWATF